MKNFKKKFLSAMLACLMLSPCAAGFASCDNGGGNPSDSGNAGGVQHEHTWSANFSYNDSKHYKICSGCNEKLEEGEHTYGTDGYTCTVCGYENESRKPAQKQNAADVFGGVKASYVRGNITDADGTAKSFNEILDRQIDLLAQDILYRLNYVYGTDGTNRLKTQTGEQTLFNLNNTVFAFNNFSAKIKDSAIISQTTSCNHDVFALTCLNCIQNNLNSYTGTNVIYNPNFLNFSGAIVGNNTALNMVQLTANKDNLWICKTNNSSENTSNFVTDNKDSFKYAIAQILAGETVSENYSAENYQSVLQKIDSTGFADDCKNKFVQLIYSNIIGNDLVEKDLSYFNSSYFKNNSYIVNNDFMINAPYPGNTAYTEAENAASPRLYKCYNVVVPAIVERAIENTFDGSEISLYPAMNRYAVQSFDNLSAVANEAQAYESIVLMPKAEISATKLALKIKGANNIGVKCEINGEAVQVSAANDGELLLIDLHAYAKKIGAYNGGKENDFSNNLFGNSGAGAAGINNGAHYIKLIFENPNGGKFSVEIDGYYNK